MSEKQYLAEDQELMAIFARKKAGRAERNPAVEVRILPADRAEEVCALDERIQKVKPLVLPVCIGGLAVVMASVGWMHWVLAGITCAACLVCGAGKYREA